MKAVPAVGGSGTRLRSIEAFVLVGRLLSLQKAATALHITVPAVSRRINLLERHVDLRLFHRLPRGLSLTEAGAALFSAKAV